jgi:hypothetical protein
MSDTRDSYPWYAIVQQHGSLEQGDFIKRCPIIELKDIGEVEKESSGMADSDSGILTEGLQVEGEASEYDVIVISQSCDIKNEKIPLILVCPYYKLSEAGEPGKRLFPKSDKNKKENLRQGRIMGYHLLNRCELAGFETDDYLVVDFRTVYAVPFRTMMALAKMRMPRLRLLPPYREHLSQAFARMFMRVGLPTDIPPFKS